MTNERDVLTAQLSVDLRRYEKGFLRAQKLTDRRLAAMEKRFDRGVDRMAKSGSRMADGFNRAIATIGVGFAIREAGQLSDAWTEASNKIKAASVSFGGELGSVADIAAIANETRTGLDSTVDLYSRFARAAGKLGKTQEEVAKATEVANKAFKAGGATISEVNSSILQLSQGLQSGALQGEELRAIRENAPLLAEAIADAMNVSVGELKALGAEGKITGDVIFKALAGGAQKIEAQYAVTVPTISDSITNLRNKAAEFVGTSDDMAASAEAVSKFILVVANNLDLLADAAVAAAVAIGGAKLGLAMANFAMSMKTTNALLVRASAQMGAVNAASAIAARGVTALGVAFKAAGGPYAVIFGGIALAIFSIVKASKEAARQQAEWSARIDSAEAKGREYSNLLDELKRRHADGGDAAEVAAGKQADLARAYETTADAVDRLNKAEKERFVSAARDEYLEAKAVADEIRARIPSTQRVIDDGTGRIGGTARIDTKETKALREELERATANADRLYQVGIDAAQQQEDIFNSASQALKKQQESARKKLESEAAANAIRARGNAAEIQALEDRKKLEADIVALRETGLDEGEAKRIAQANLKAVQDARKALASEKSAPATQKAIDKEDDLKADRARLDLTNQISVAQAAGNQAQIAALTRQLEIVQLAAEFEQAGYSPDLAAKKAADQQVALDNAERDAQARAQSLAISERELEIDLQAAAIRGDNGEVDRLARIFEIRQRVYDLKRLGLSDDLAQKQAEDEQRELDIATAIAKKNFEYERELSFQLVLAETSGNTSEIERLEREISLLRTKNSLIAGGKRADIAEGQAKQEQIEIDKAELEGQIRDAAKGAFRAAVDGEFGDYLSNKLSNAADNMFDKAIDGLLDVLLNQVDLGGIFGGGSGSGLGSIFAGFFDSGGNIPSGQFGIVGERGPEIVTGPANVMSRVDTSKALAAQGSQSITSVNYAPVYNLQGYTTADLNSELDRRAADARREFPALLAQTEDDRAAL